MKIAAAYAGNERNWKKSQAAGIGQKPLIMQPLEQLADSKRKTSGGLGVGQAGVGTFTNFDKRLSIHAIFDGGLFRFAERNLLEPTQPMPPPGKGAAAFHLASFCI